MIRCDTGRVARRSKTEWVQLAETAIMGIVADHKAVTIREIEARAADRTWRNLGDHIDPHHLTEARRSLEAQGRITSTTTRTRGPGAPITTYHLPRTYGSATAIDRASARKRLLTARFQGWARATQRYPSGLVGRAGETALSSALTASANAGYVPAAGRYGETGHLLGMTVPGGPLDNAAFLTVPDHTGVPTVYTLPFEVKNIREWVYGRSPELHQLLHKAARLQVAHPTVPIVAVLVCRKRHETTRRLGIATGFYSIQYRTQLVAPAPVVTDQRFTEVQTELGYEDIRRTTDPPAALLKALRESVTRDAARTAQRWADCAPVLVEHFDTLRRPLPHRQRTTAWNDLLDAIRNLGISYTGES